jgi:hypothetical protein
VNAKLIDALVPDLPFVGRREFVKVHGFEDTQADGTTDVAIATANIDTPQALVIQADKAVTVKLGAITLEPGGIIVVYGGTPATNPPTVSNASGETATIRGVVLGE